MFKSEFKEILNKIEENETNYDIREIYVAQAMYLAKILGYKSGIRADDPDWPVWCIELPDIGEITWHCPSFKIEYDNHTTNEKISRIRDFCETQ